MTNEQLNALPDYAREEIMKLKLTNLIMEAETVALRGIVTTLTKTVTMSTKFSNN